MNSHNYSTLWISNAIDSSIPFLKKLPLVSCQIKFGLPVYLILAIFLVLRGAYLSPEYLVSYFLTVIWLSFCPYLIWRYDEILLPNFFNIADDIVVDHNRLQILAKKYDRLFSSRFLIITLPWIILVLLCLISSSSHLEDGGIFGMYDPWFWIIMLLALWFCYLSGIGIWGVIVTILTVRGLSHERLIIDPLHSDKLGGLSCIGSFVIGTTLLFASGTLILPLMIQVANETISSKFYGYALIGIYIFFILASFLYPILKINRQVKQNQISELEDMRRRYNGISDNITVYKARDINKLNLYLELDKIRSE